MLLFAKIAYRGDVSSNQSMQWFLSHFKISLSEKNIEKATRNKKTLTKTYFQLWKMTDFHTTISWLNSNMKRLQILTMTKF